MVQYPARVPRESYRGSKPNLRQKAMEYNDVALKMEEYINKRVRSASGDIVQLLYVEIARGIGVSEELVRKVGFAVDCGNNGMTICKGAGLA